jgi:hypothetical protein
VGRIRRLSRASAGASNALTRLISEFTAGTIVGAAWTTCAVQPRCVRAAQTPLFCKPTATNLVRAVQTGAATTCRMAASVVVLVTPPPHIGAQLSCLRAASVEISINSAAFSGVSATIVMLLSGQKHGHVHGNDSPIHGEECEDVSQYTAVKILRVLCKGPTITKAPELKYIYVTTHSSSPPCCRVTISEYFWCLSVVFTQQRKH